MLMSRMGICGVVRGRTRCGVGLLIDVWDAGVVSGEIGVFSVRGGEIKFLVSLVFSF